MSKHSEAYRPLKGLSSTDLAIANAIKAGTLAIAECEGRFGPYWSIEDDHGVIEVALSREEADERIGTIRAAL